jgi:hypothetical protein
MSLTVGRTFSTQRFVHTDPLGSVAPAMGALKLSAVHLLRLGDGPDAVRIEARGRGFIFGSFGALAVRGNRKVVRAARLPAGRGWAVFVGLHGARFARVQLAPAVHHATPAIDSLRPPSLPKVARIDGVGVELTVNPPEPP